MTQYTLTVRPDDVAKGKWMVVIHGGRLIGIPARGLSNDEAESRLQCLAFAYEFGLKEATARVGAMRWTVNVNVDAMKEGT